MRVRIRVITPMADASPTCVPTRPSWVCQVLQVHRACPWAAGRADVDLAEDLEYEDGSEQDDHPVVGQMRQLDVPEHHEAVAAVDPGRLPLLL